MKANEEFASTNHGMECFSQHKFLRSFLRRRFEVKAVVASRNVSCFLRLANSTKTIANSTKQDRLVMRFKTSNGNKTFRYAEATLVVVVVVFSPLLGKELNVHEHFTCE